MVDGLKIPLSVKFTCTKSHINGNMKELGNEYDLQSQLLRREIEHGGVTEHNWERKEAYRSAKIETSRSFLRGESQFFCKRFNTGNWEILNGSVFLTVKDHNPIN